MNRCQKLYENYSLTRPPHLFNLELMPISEMTSGGPNPRIPEFLHPIRSTERGYRRKVRILIIYDSDHPYGHPLRIFIIVA